MHRHVIVADVAVAATAVGATETIVGTAAVAAVTVTAVDTVAGATVMTAVTAAVAVATGIAVDIATSS